MQTRGDSMDEEKKKKLNDAIAVLREECKKTLFMRPLPYWAKD